MKITVDFESEIKKLREEVKLVERSGLAERTQFAVESLKRTTPIDTGYARSRWTHRMENGVGIISNDAPYIGVLNEGHSKQAPKFFIEITLAAIGELEFPVYENTK